MSEDDERWEGEEGNGRRDQRMGKRRNRSEEEESIVYNNI